MAVSLPMGNRWRELLDRLLPWFDPAIERQRNARTERIRKRSIVARIRAERVIEEYQQAASAASRAGNRLVKETRRDR